MRKGRLPVLVIVLVLVALSAQAQWLPQPPSGSGPIYYTGGNVGVGTTAPANLFHLYDPRGGVGPTAAAIDIESAAGGYGAGIRFRSRLTGTSTVLTMARITSDGEQAWNDTAAYQNAGLRFFTTLAGVENERVRIFADGSMSVGVTGANAPVAKLRVIGDILFGSNAVGGYSDLRLSTDAQQPPGGPIYQQVNSITPVTIPTSGTLLTALWLKNATNGPGTNQIDLVVDGNISAKFQDVAEWVPAAVSMEPGTVVVIDPQVVNHVMPSSKPYDTSVAGVVSAQPGLTLGVGSADKAKIATTGRVKVKVDATARPIHIGDLLVTSRKNGLAMVSEPVDVGGVKMHRPGTVIGKALEPLREGEGEILVLLSLQ